MKVILAEGSGGGGGFQRVAAAAAYVCLCAEQLVFRWESEIWESGVLASTSSERRITQAEGEREDERERTS